MRQVQAPLSQDTKDELVYTWVAVKNDIELKIILGEYAAGERIPSGRKIAETHGIAVATSNHALAELCKDGTIYQRRGVGYFVKPYVRERLLAEHRRKLEKIIQDAFDYADKIGVDLVPIINAITKNMSVQNPAN